MILAEINIKKQKIHIFIIVNVFSKSVLSGDLLLSLHFISVIYQKNIFEFELISPEAIHPIFQIV